MQLNMTFVRPGDGGSEKPILATYPLAANALASGLIIADLDNDWREDCAYLPRAAATELMARYRRMLAEGTYPALGSTHFVRPCLDDFDDLLARGCDLYIHH